MNWNGKTKNEVLGKLQACREQISVVQQRGYVSEAASWLLDKVDPEKNTMISLISPIQWWADELSLDERETWLVWALRNRPKEIAGWLGYRDGWSLVPAACREAREIKRLANKRGLPILYITPLLPWIIPPPVLLWRTGKVRFYL